MASRARRMPGALLPPGALQQRAGRLGYRPGGGGGALLHVLLAFPGPSGSTPRSGTWSQTRGKLKERQKGRLVPTMPGSAWLREGPGIRSCRSQEPPGPIMGHEDHSRLPKPAVGSDIVQRSYLQHQFTGQSGAACRLPAHPEALPAQEQVWTVAANICDTPPTHPQ